MNVLTIDIGGTNIKILATGQKEPRKFPSGPTLSPRQMVDGVKKLAADWNYDVVSIGYPGVVVKDRILTEPHNLAKGWVGFNFKAAFRRPVKIINDAAMQALGSYKKGQMLFLGLGTGLGSAMVVEGVVVPMELGPSFIPERNLRGLCRPARIKAARQEEMAETCRVRREPADFRPSGERRRNRRRQCQEPEETAAPLQARQQCLCLHWRISHVGNRTADAAKKSMSANFEQHPDRLLVTAGLPFPELKARSLVNARAKAADASPDFSELIRIGLPSL